jgi:plasmid replication initiation protein
MDKKMTQTDLQVVKSNQVIEASYHLSTVEQRLVLAAISRIPKNQPVTDDEVYLVTTDEMRALGVHEKTVYRDLKEAVSRLYERSININIEGVSIKMRWVQEVRFMDSQGVIGIRFSKSILPFISNLSREFTKYALSDIAGMSSAYAIRIYELITQYKDIGKREVAVADLRHMLELGTRYPLFADFKRWVVETAVDQINAHSPLHVTYELRKTGRKYTHIIFFFSLKKVMDVTATQRDPDTPDFFTGMTDKEATALANQLAADADFGSRYAYAGENLHQFSQRIKQDLISGSNDKKYVKYLKRKIN